MASISFHSRPTSLPFTCHSLDAATEDSLSRLRLCEQSSTSSSLCRNLVDIKDLYELINDIIVLPLYQQVLSRDELNRGKAEDALEGSLVLLDVCGVSVDLVSQMKDSVQELESSLRRRGGAVNVLSAYRASRRKVTKSVSKCLKKVELPRLEKDEPRVVFIVRILREAQSICFSTLKSLIAFLSGSKTRWCPLLFGQQVERIDKNLFALDAKNLTTDVQSLQGQLQAMEKNINEIQDGLVMVSRCLVKTRGALLNVLNH